MGVGETTYLCSVSAKCGLVEFRTSPLFMQVESRACDLSVLRYLDSDVVHLLEFVVMCVRSKNRPPKPRSGICEDLLIFEGSKQLGGAKGMRAARQKCGDVEMELVKPGS